MKLIFRITSILSLSALALLAQDASKFNGTWKGDGGQVRKLTWKDGVITMEETQVNGSMLVRQYPTEGQEITMNVEGVWKDSKATGKMEGNKLSVDTTMPNGTKWHDEWTMADDGKTYSALRVNTAVGTGGLFGNGRGAGGGRGAGAGAGAAGRAEAGAGGGAARGPAGGGGGGRARGGGGPETFTKIQ